MNIHKIRSNKTLDVSSHKYIYKLYHTLEDIKYKTAV